MPHQEFFAGFLAAGFAVIAVFFFRFWNRTKDGLFMAFSIAFALLALQQVLTTFLGLPEEHRSWVYGLRLVAFSVIIFAIMRKNMGR